MAKRQWVTPETTLPPALWKGIARKEERQDFSREKRRGRSYFFVGKQKSAW